MTDNIYPYEMRICYLCMTGHVCAECGASPTQVLYELLDGPNKGVYLYCEECAVELGLVVPVAKAAEWLDVSPRTIRTWCGREKLHAFWSNHGRWWIMTDPHFGGVRIKQEAAD